MGECIGIVAALREEIKVIKEVVNPKEEWTINSFVHSRGFYRGWELVLVWSGMGEKNATEATKTLLNNFSPRAVISLGIAGAVDPRLQIGDLIVAQQIRFQHRPQALISADDQLVEAALRAGQRISIQTYSGQLVTVTQVISSSEEKGRIYRETGALAVEMESGFVGEEATRMGCPFLAIRSISDTADYSFRVDVNQITTDNGDLHPGRFIRYCLRHPPALWELVKMKMNMGKATRQLGQLVREFIPLIPNN